MTQYYNNAVQLDTAILKTNFRYQLTFHIINCCVCAPRTAIKIHGRCQGQEFDVTNVKHIIDEHLSALMDKFDSYFPKETDPRKENGWIRDPFSTLSEDNKLPVHLEDALLDLSANGELQICFQHESSLPVFWIKARAEYPDLGKLAIKTLLPFPSTYLCESGFSTMSVLKTKYRNALNVSPQFRVAMSNIEPNLDKLVSMKQAHLNSSEL